MAAWSSAIPASSPNCAGAGAAPRNDRAHYRRARRASAIRAAGEGAHARLLRALAYRGRGVWQATASEQRLWVSALFQGTRHRITGEVTGTAEGFLEGLDEAAFVIAGHVVVDVTVVERDGATVTIEALTVQEG